jgi:hypothetical protein
MAEALRDQVDALTGFSTTEDLALKDWFEAGIKEVINYMPPKLLKLCAAMQTFTSVAAGSEAETLNTGKLLSVLSSNTRCREIASDLKGRASDSDDILYATSTDPVFYVEANLLNALPSGLSCKYEEVQYPTVTVASDTAIAVFPDEAEYLVVLYAAIKALQVLMNDKATATGDTAIATALTALTQCITNAGTEIGLAKTEAANIPTTADTYRTDGGDPALFGDESQYETSEGLKKVNTALDRAITYIDGNFFSSDYDLRANFADIDAALAAEDIELGASRVQQAQATMAAVQTDISLAQAHIADWNAAISALTSEIGAFTSGVQAYVNTANAYLSQASSKAGEIQVRVSILTTDYSWLEKQQMKLQSDYDRGLMALSGRQFERPRAGA